MNRLFVICFFIAFHAIYCRFYPVLHVRLLCACYAHFSKFSALNIQLHKDQLPQ